MTKKTEQAVKLSAKATATCTSNVHKAVAMCGSVLSLERQIAQLRDEADSKESTAWDYMVRAARAAGNAEAFHAICEEVYSDYRANKEGIAESCGLNQAKTTSGEPQVDEEGNPVYTVPTTLQTHRSILAKSLRLGVSLVREGTKQAIPSQASIQKANKAAADKAGEANKGRKAKKAETPDAASSERADKAANRVEVSDPSKAELKAATDAEKYSNLLNNRLENIRRNAADLKTEAGRAMLIKLLDEVNRNIKNGRFDKAS